MIKRQGYPSLVNIDKSGSNKAALDQIKKLFWATLGFKKFHCAQKTLIGFELMHMIKKGQLPQVGEMTLSPAEQFYTLAA